MKPTSLRKTLSSVTLAGGIITAANALALAKGRIGESYEIMGGNGTNWMGGYGGGMSGYGGWLPILLVIVITGLVVWFFTQKKK